MTRTLGKAAGEGLEYRLDIARPGDTFDAHRLLHLADQTGLRAATKERFLAAYFTEGKAIGDRDTLVDLAAEVGVDRDRATEVLAGDEFTDSVRRDEREAAQLGISGVPFFAIDRRYGISGAQPPELLLQALDQAWEKSQEPTEAAQSSPSTPTSPKSS